jgi:predicted chitinase
MRPVEALKKLMPNCHSNYVSAFEKGEPLFVHYGVTTPKRMAHFLGQFGAETGGGTILYENLSYTTTSRLLQVFGVGNHSAKITASEAPGLLRNPVALAERVYGLKNPTKAKELGNTRPGDGGRYRGTGILQTTGGYNFKKAGEKVGVDFYNHPELIISPEHALKPALWEWDHSRCNQMADAGDVLSISRAINLGNASSSRTPNGMGDRRLWTDRAMKVLSGQNLTFTSSGASTAPVAPRETQPTKPVDPNFGKVAKPKDTMPPMGKPSKGQMAGTGAVVVATGTAVQQASASGFSSLTLIAIGAAGLICAAAFYVVWSSFRQK